MYLGKNNLLVWLGKKYYCRKMENDRWEYRWNERENEDVWYVKGNLG